MNLFQFFKPSLLLMLLVTFFEPVHSYALDPRFELDPAQVLKSSGQAVRGAKSAKSGTHRRSKKSRDERLALQKNAQEYTQPVSSLHISADAAPAPVQDMQRLQAFWDTLVPLTGSPTKPLAFKTDTFDLALDASKYPLLRTVDGGTILLDVHAGLPPLVRTLIQEKDPSVRIITASPADGRRFLGAILASAGFYSVEEQPVMTFGKDPQLKLRSDFKVERTADSVLRNEVLLISASRQGVPVRLAEYLKGQGFRLLEPLAEQSVAPVGVRHRVVQASPKTPGQTVDLVLETLSVPAERGRRVELFSAAESGIALSVAADRYFEHAGRRYVVTRFTGDPIAYTLFRLLETKGFRVVITEPKDDFRAVATKLLSRMELPSSYTPHLLVADPGGKYSLELSGFMLEKSGASGGATMLTDRPLEGALRELLYDHGYQVQER